MSRDRRIAYGVALAIAVLLLWYSQTRAFSWDEGYHLLAAQLVKSGKRLYLDFCFPQTPLNTYWNAAWMSILGESWRGIHVVAALLCCGAAWLASGFARARFPEAPWRAACGLAVLLAVGLNVVVVQYGPIGQAYAFTLILIVAAFRMTVAAVEREHAGLAALAGLAAGGGAAATLLSAPVGPVLLVWMLVYNRAGNRWRKALALAAGEAVAFLPLLWLFLKDPSAVYFNIIEYQMFHRKLGWEGAIRHDLTVWTAWLDSSHGMILALLAAGGLLFVKFRSRWERAQRAEFFLAAWLAAALMVHISQAHPTFQQYYMLSVPFVAILASAGLYALGSQLLSPERPYKPVMALALVLVLGLAKTIYEEDAITWPKMEEVARQVSKVTPLNVSLLADENVYFLTRHTPPSGMELLDSHKLDFPKDKAARLHVVSAQEVWRRIGAGEFATVESCGEYETFDEAAAPAYKKKVTIGTCTVYWQR